MKKSQLSTELIITLSALLIMFLIIISIMNKRSDDYFYNKRLMDAKEYSEKISSQINILFLAGPGTKAHVELPQTLRDNTPYSINIYPQHHIVEITWMSKNNIRHYSTQILTSNISGKLSNISNDVNITNTDGGIFVEG